MSKTTPAFFKDFNKPADTILNDDYSLKRTLKVKHVTPDGVVRTCALYVCMCVIDKMGMHV